MFTILKNVEVRRKILFTLFVVLVFRLLTHVPVPGVDATAIRNYVAGSTIFGFFDLFTGGGFQNFSIVTLALGPYINASIILQLLTLMIPSLEELSKEGQYGRDKIDQYTRWLTLPISILQAYGIYFLFQKQGLIQSLGVLDLSVLVFTLTAGVLFLVWLGDLVTEYGVGNGVSLLIFVGIISRLPASLLQAYIQRSTYDLPTILAFVLLSLLVIIGVVLVNEGTRNVALEYGRRGSKSQKVTNYLPIKINQAGVIPIIFAVSIVLIPSFLSSPLMSSGNDRLVSLGVFLFNNFTSTSFLYNALYFLLVVAFTFFYTFLQFNPEKVADDIKKRGGFIPGIRPGKSTKDHLTMIVVRLTLVGSVFLGLIAILPYLLQRLFGVSNLTIGGTGLLIVVSVILETVRQIDSMKATRSYEGYLR
ncbi:preprotein translocase subunit SecY [Candidatus Nomurabacteria bacterium]|uniref:Protein translocase subunit SecY n=1 Tax=candidate division WWE3 bacterium TaxID=2053526 RepID=A0A955E0Q2_UNCKA|nr:preprotein translocase subunit SecY [candidate division WWE3 bacterium]MCB9823765.1 preprotein translocase subunit SecY [Candidatus Nomurabacteria bacterium]MCB9826829.1 preprotein translocase subunit SecY [Candidatus Nomurabacteria bacterium]MCB9827560.1 preprotein translocase subunit SecY [Candidatus Nomurabacteria bacterium]HXK52950.1 preprotein translocase subunit SecY [bacterium]